MKILEKRQNATKLTNKVVLNHQTFAGVACPAGLACSSVFRPLWYLVEIRGRFLLAS